jgi:hypothetical protein
MKVYLGPYETLIERATRFVLQPLGYDNVQSIIRWLNKFPIIRDAKRKSFVKIDDYDIWSLDATLALIVYPALVKLKDTKHGTPYVKYEDVPEEFRLTEEEYKEIQYWNTENPNLSDIEAKFQGAWDWILDEMIFAFQSLVEDLDAKYYVGGTDYDGLDKHEERVANGFRLFGTYYRALWD